MNSLQAWQLFMKTGEVSAYLAYKDTQDKPFDPAHKDVYNAYKDQGNSAAQNSSIGK